MYYYKADSGSQNTSHRRLSSLPLLMLHSQNQLEIDKEVDPRISKKMCKPHSVVERMIPCLQITSDPITRSLDLGLHRQTWMPIDLPKSLKRSKNRIRQHRNLTPYQSVPNYSLDASGSNVVLSKYKTFIICFISLWYVDLNSGGYGGYLV